MNVAGLDLNLLLVFEAVLEERNVTRAAARVGLSQPAMSNALARLRVFFKDPLFVRSENAMRLTPRAEQFSGAVRSVLSMLREALEAPRNFDPASSVRRFRVGLTDDLELRLSRCFASGFATGGLTLQTRRLDGLFLIPETALRHGALDLAIGYFPDARSVSADIVLETIATERNVVVARRGHAAFRRKLTVERFASLDHAALIYSNEPSGLIDRELAAKGLSRRLRLALPHVLSVLHAVASSDLIACVPESAASAWRDRLGLVVRPEPLGLPPFVIRMAWHRHSTDSPAHMWLRRLAGSALRPEPSPESPFADSSHANRQTHARINVSNGS
jgi:DNA-binding transcriptional LysR family regulator